MSSPDLVPLLAGFRVAQERRGLLSSTIDHREARLRCWAGWMAPRSLLTADQGDVERFLDRRRVVSKTRYCWLSTLHAFYGWVRREHAGVIDPTVDIDRPRLRPGFPRPILTRDLSYVLLVAPANRRAALMLGAYAGLRCAEIAWMERDWLDEDRETLRVFGKGAKVRMVDLHPAVLEALLAMGLPRTGRVFRRPSGGSFTPRQVSEWMNPWLHSVGVAATMHQLRHWFGTEAYRATKDLRAVQELLGHSSPTVTAVYTRLDGEVGRAAVRALPLLDGHQRREEAPVPHP